MTRFAYHRGVRAYQAGNAHIWVTCAAARYVVGHYAMGATAAFAHDLARSVDSVERYAAAGRTYRLLRRTYGDVLDPRRGKKNSEMLRKLQEARAVLSYSHFYALAVAWSAQEFGPREAMAYLMDAAQKRTPVEQFRNELTREKPDLPGPRGVTLPTWALGEGQVQRKLAEHPETRIVILDGFPECAEVRVTPVTGRNGEK